MISRCYDSNVPRYRDWGGRGITVCDEWRHSFEAFFSHVGRKPHPSRLLDRINNDGHYEPGNVRWATPLESSRNRRHQSRFAQQ